MKLLSKARIVEYDEDGEPSRMIGSHLDITETINLQEELQKSLDEKVILLTEIHHRVKNNLAIIGGLFELQALNSEDEKVNDVLKGMGNRVKSIADVHELLYNSDSFAQISMEDYLKKLIRNISKTYCDCQKVRVDLNINSQLKLNINQAIPLGLMLNELITNSYKYAFEDVEAPLICFSLTHKDDKYIASYSDNGPGFSVNEFEEAKSLGFTLINALLEQLSAEYTTPGNHSYPLNFSFSHQLKGSHSALK
jgi:two-component sensor histidine kinase